MHGHDFCNSEKKRTGLKSPLACWFPFWSRVRVSVQGVNDVKHEQGNTSSFSQAFCIFSNCHSFQDSFSGCLDHEGQLLRKLEASPYMSLSW